MTDSVDGIRWKIEELDNEILDLIEKRMKAALYMGGEKVRKGMPVRNDIVLQAALKGDAVAKEIFAQAVMGSEAHAEPHRYKVTTYGWKGGVYVPVNTKTTGKAYDNGIAAIETSAPCSRRNSWMSQAKTRPGARTSLGPANVPVTSCVARPTM